VVYSKAMLVITISDVVDSGQCYLDGVGARAPTPYKWRGTSVVLSDEMHPW
jgi:hypothetical protein